MSEDTKNTQVDNPASDIQKQLEELKARNEYLEAEAKKAFEKRDMTKKELEQIKQKQLEDQGKFQDLYAQTKAELEAKLEEYNKLNEEFVKTQERLNELVNTQREELLGQLDGDARKFAEQLDDIGKLREFVKLHKVERPNVDTGTTITHGAPAQSYGSFADWKKAQIKQIGG